MQTLGVHVQRLRFMRGRLGKYRCLRRDDLVQRQRAPWRLMRARNPWPSENVAHRLPLVLGEIGKCWYLRRAVHVVGHRLRLVLVLWLRELRVLVHDVSIFVMHALQFARGPRICGCNCGCGPKCGLRRRVHGFGRPPRFRRMGSSLLVLLLAVLVAAAAEVLQQARVAGSVVLYGLVDGDERQVRGDDGQPIWARELARQLGPCPSEVGVSERDVLAPLVLLPLVEPKRGPVQVVVHILLHVLVVVQLRQHLRALRDAGEVDFKQTGRELKDIPLQFFKLEQFT